MIIKHYKSFLVSTAKVQVFFNNSIKSKRERKFNAFFFKSIKYFLEGKEKTTFIYNIIKYNKYLLHFYNLHSEIKLIQKTSCKH